MLTEKVMYLLYETNKSAVTRAFLIGTRSGSADGLFGPAMADFRHKLLFVLLQLADQYLIAGFFVPAGPQNHFRQHVTKIHAFGCDAVNEIYPIPLSFGASDDSL